MWPTGPVRPRRVVYRARYTFGSRGSLCLVIKSSGLPIRSPEGASAVRDLPSRHERRINNQREGVGGGDTILEVHYN